MGDDARVLAERRLLVRGEAARCLGDRCAYEDRLRRLSELAGSM